MNTSAHTAPKLLILADDLSGAADCAVAGVRAGLRSAVMLRADVGHPIGYPTSADVLALDTDTRRANAVDAAATQVAGESAPAI